MHPVLKALLGAAALGAAACVPADPRSVASLRMAERLAALEPTDGDAATAVTRDFLGNRPERIPELRAEIETTADPVAVYELRAALAMELLMDGRSDEALGVARSLGEQIDRFPPGVDAETRRQAWLNTRLLRGIAAMRLGEQENCIANHGVHSCILPVARDGVHKLQRGSRAAIVNFGEVLRDSPDDLAARWLLNIAYMTLGEYPARVPPRYRIEPSAFESEADLPTFVDRAVGSGVDMLGLAGGAIVEDFDGDGWLDIVASSWGFADQLRFFRNRGDGTFEDRTRVAGLEGQVGGLNVSHADYDNDGNPDILVLRGAWLNEGGRHPNSLLRNLGDGRFEDVTEAAGLLSLHPTQVGVWADYDNDGWLDLFVGNEQWTVDRQHLSELFHNNGDGTFTDCAFAAGLADLGPVKGAAWGDYDDDRFPDLYVSRLGATNLLFRNTGSTGDGPCEWSFAEVADEAGVREPAFSFPTWFFDYDNDGDLDLFVAAWDGSPVENVAAYYLGHDYRGEVPRLYRNDGDGSFTDVTIETRLNRALLTMGANFGDVDADGFPDIYLGTGAPDLRTLIPNRLFRNDAGAVFQDATTAAGVGHLQKGHGVAFGDLDNDGDEDLYATMGGFFSGDSYQNVLFENPGHGHRFVTLRFEGLTSNRFGVGNRIAVKVRTPAGPRTIHAVVSTGGSFGSSSLQQEIGLGDAEAIESIEVFWPASGQRQSYRNVELDRTWRVREGAEILEPVEMRQLRLRGGAGAHH